MLLWLAYTNLHGPFVQADGHLAMDIANILRSPDRGTLSLLLLRSYSLVEKRSDSSLGRLVLQTIIPTVQFLSERLKFTLGDLFSSDLLKVLNINSNRLCSDLSASDALFAALPSK